MPQQFSDKIRRCYERAAEAKEWADDTNDPALKVEFLNTEWRWLTLARSYGFTESLEDFNAANAEQRRKFDERLQHSGVLVRACHERVLGAERLASLLTLAHEPIFAWRLDGVIDFWNTGAARLYGFVPDEAVGRSSHTLLQTKFPICFAELRSELLKEHAWSGELRHACKDGREVIVDSRMQLLGDGTVLEVNRDITEQKQIEVALGKGERGLLRLASIVESSDDAIVSKNLDGVITSWNKAAERVFGYTAEEAVGKSVTILIPAERQDEEPAMLARIRRGERIDHYETIRQRKDGSLINISLTVSPVKNAQGKIVGASKIARDITERKRHDDLIALLAREAEHRTKNILATVQATVNLSHAETVDGFKLAIEGRIQALAKLHDLFVKSRWTGAELSHIAAQELAPYVGEGEARARIDGPYVLLAPDTAQVIGVTLHELATNAAKYGALSVPEGRVEIKWSLAANDRLILTWTEKGGPEVKKPLHRGFGTRVMERIIRDQHQGDFRLNWGAEGLACEIILPVVQ